MTPEGKVKAAVKKILREYGPSLYCHFPVLNGMGAPTLDCIGALDGRMFAIETKAPGKKPTARQEITIAQMRAAGIAVFVVDGSEDTYTALAGWLQAVDSRRK